MLIEECGHLPERLLGLGNPIIKLILSMRLPLIDLKLCVDASRSELPMHPHRIAQQQVACSISTFTIYSCKAKYGVWPNEAQRLYHLQDENSRLKRLVADLSLNREMLKPLPVLLSNICTSKYDVRLAHEKEKSVSELTLHVLSSAVARTAAGFRSITRLQPLDGPGGKIFPATYVNGVYAVEKRRIKNGSGEEKDVDAF